MTDFFELPIAVRAYTELPGKQPLATASKWKAGLSPSEYVLIFDCETTTDAAQRLRLGFYQVRMNGELVQEGAFYDPDMLSTDEIKTLQAYARRYGLASIPVREFREKVFFHVGYELRGTIVGFNLPFDLSRLAIDHGSARGWMRGGFSFLLSENRRLPRIRVKHLSRRAAIIEFAKPGKQEAPRGTRKRNLASAAHRGFFVDIKTLAAALTSASFTLASLCDFLETDTRKQETEEHGGTITASYLDYAWADVQATWECYGKLIERYEEHDLSTPPHKILSEASIGKAYLKDMGIMPLLACQPDFPRETFGKIMSAYYGGRAEVRLRRQIARVLHCDFKSMYPTVNALMGLWRFVIAGGIEMRDATEETRQLLESVTLADLQSPAIWKRLAVLVRVRPDYDLLPVRAKYDGKSNTIGLNYLTNHEPQWFTLADCIAAKLLSGKAPIIEETIGFEPLPPQEALRPVDLFGNPRYRVDPRADDVFKRLVDLRDEAKANGDPAEQAMKIIANAASYGIFIEINRDDAPKPEPIAVYGPDGEGFETVSTAIEEPGRYFNPLLGVLITGAARLMLALAERLTTDAGLGWVCCDTDSLAIAKPEDIGEATFIAQAQTVIDWFEPLNPYEKAGSILKIEDANYDCETEKQIVPLFALAISAKRYALFNLDEAGKPILRKASAHGLGQLIPPYTEQDAPSDIPAPAVPLSEIGVERWQHDLWVKIVEAALGDHPERLPLDWHPTLNRPAVSRYGATSPRLLKWFDGWNRNRTYADRVKPFGFLMGFQARTGPLAAGEIWEFAELPKRGAPKKRKAIAPVAPYEPNTAKAPQKAFDRNTGKPISPDRLMTYAEALAQYHLSPESKFANAGAWDRGLTERRHVVATGRARLIGKEGNRIEEEGLGTGDGVVEFRNTEC